MIRIGQVFEVFEVFLLLSEVDALCVSDNSFNLLNLTVSLVQG